MSTLLSTQTTAFDKLRNLRILQLSIPSLQETHIEEHVTEYGYRLVDAIGRRFYGVQTYFRQDIDDLSVIHNICVDNILILGVKVSETSIIRLLFEFWRPHQNNVLTLC